MIRNNNTPVLLLITFFLNESPGSLTSVPIALAVATKEIRMKNIRRDMIHEQAQ